MKVSHYTPKKTTEPTLFAQKSHHFLKAPVASFYRDAIHDTIKTMYIQAQQDSIYTSISPE